MKRPVAYVIPTVLLISILLESCSFSIKALEASPSSEDVSTLAPSASPMDQPTETAAAPTLVLPSVAPVPFGVETIQQLKVSQTFVLGDVVRGVAFSPDGKVLAAAGGNEQNVPIRLWDLSSGQSLGELAGHVGIVWDLAFSPDGQMLASVSADQTAKIWDWRDQTLIQSLDFPGQAVSVSFAPDGQTLAVGGVDEMENQIQHAAIWTYSVHSWTELLKFYDFLNIQAMAYSPDGKWLVGGGTSRNVQVWRVSDGALIFTLNHAHQVMRASISPDSTLVATATCATVSNGECTEGGIWLWDILTGRLLKKLGGFPDTVVSLAFSADGAMLVAASRDGTLRFYDASADQILHELRAPSGVSAFALSPGGTRLATGSDSGEIQLWQIVSP